MKEQFAGLKRKGEERIVTTERTELLELRNRTSVLEEFLLSTSPCLLEEINSFSSSVCANLSSFRRIMTQW